jgi:hypothetical protein
MFFLSKSGSIMILPSLMYFSIVWCDKNMKRSMT